MIIVSIFMMIFGSRSFPVSDLFVSTFRNYSGNMTILLESAACLHAVRTIIAGNSVFTDFLKIMFWNFFEIHFSMNQGVYIIIIIIQNYPLGDFHSYGGGKPASWCWRLCIGMPLFWVQLYSIISFSATAPSVRLSAFMATASGQLDGKRPDTTDASRSAGIKNLKLF